MLVKLVEVYTSGTYSDNGNIKPKYRLRETYVNPDHVVCMREENTLAPTVINEDMDPRQGFTKLHINRGQAGLDITVVGSLPVIEEKLHKSLKAKKYCTVDMSKQNKRDGVLIRGQTLENWDRLLDKESTRIRVLIKNYAREENGLMADTSFDVLCDYLAMCNQMRILVQAFLEDLHPNEISVRISPVEHMAYKTLAKSVEIIRNRLRDEFHISMEPI